MFLTVSSYGMMERDIRARRLYSLFIAYSSRDRATVVYPLFLTSNIYLVENDFVRIFCLLVHYTGLM